jgi:hypothetical protein
MLARRGSDPGENMYTPICALFRIFFSLPKSATTVKNRVAFEQKAFAITGLLEKLN